MPENLAAVLLELRELRGEVRRLSTAVKRLTSSGPRDDADRDLLVEIARAAGDLTFTAAELFRDAALRSAGLRAALIGADIDNARQLGKLLRRLERAVIADLRVVRTDVDDRAGIRWRVLRV